MLCRGEIGRCLPDCDAGPTFWALGLLALLVRRREQPRPTLAQHRDLVHCVLVIKDATERQNYSLPSRPPLGKPPGPAAGLPGWPSGTWCHRRGWRGGPHRHADRCSSHAECSGGRSPDAKVARALPPKLLAPAAVAMVDRPPPAMTMVAITARRGWRWSTRPVGCPATSADAAGNLAAHAGGGSARRNRWCGPPPPAT